MTTSFTEDRLFKYGYGVLRLCLVLAVALAWNSSTATTTYTLPISLDTLYLHGLAYLTSLRWLGHAYIGSIGAVVNVNIVGFETNLVMLLLAAAFIVYDVVTFDTSMVVYLMKTFGGDFIAGR
jgi:hypothetical protein